MNSKLIISLANSVSSLVPGPTTTSVGGGLSKDVAIVLVVGFFLLAALMIPLHFRQKKKVKQFKEKQLRDFYQNNPRKTHMKYEDTKMFLPSWERTKYSAPIILFIVFIVIAISILVGSTLISR